MKPGRCFVFIVLAVFLSSTVVCTANQTKSLSESERLGIALEALSRIETDPETDPALKAAVYNLLDKLRGKPEFVRIVKKFKLKDQGAGLLEIAQADSSGELGVEAVKMLMGADNLEFLKEALDSSDQKQLAQLIAVLGNAKDQKSVPLLLPLLKDQNRDSTARKVAVRSLAQTQEGAMEVLKLVRACQLLPDLRLVASEELNAVRWPKMKSEAEQLLPLPKSRHLQPLPSIAQMVKMNGNAANGEKLYFSETLACAACHQVQGRGIEIGPNLSEIGTKLAREALFEAILDPNAGISFGYEAHELELKSGDEAYGLLASETEDEIAIKDLKGIVTRFKKAEITSRKQLSSSIMPSGLAEGLSPEELVDLVEYLVSLRKP